MWTWSFTTALRILRKPLGYALLTTFRFRHLQTLGSRLSAFLKSGIGRRVCTAVVSTCQLWYALFKYSLLCLPPLLGSCPSSCFQSRRGRWSAEGGGSFANTQVFPNRVLNTHKCEGRCRCSAGASLHSGSDHGSGKRETKNAHAVKVMR